MTRDEFHLSVREERELDRICDAYEQGKATGDHLDLAQVLSSVPLSLRPAAFRELVELELHYDETGSAQSEIEQLLQRFPEYSNVVHGLVEGANRQPLLSTPPDGSTDSVLGKPSDGFAGNSRFRLIRLLGRGGMGVVYEAVDAVRNEPVALKFLPRRDGRALARFKKEFRASAHITHPNLVTLYELIEDQGTWFFTMELIDGTNFFDFVRPRSFGERSLPDLSRLVACVRQLVDGVRTLHEFGRIHRDLKPSNVLVTGSGRLVVLDFGVVTMTDDLEGDSMDGGLAGTFAYMAPEQAEGRTLPACDWFSVGVMLYEALTGVRPFLGNPSQLLTAKRNNSVMPPKDLVPTIPDRLSDLCVRLLDPDPASRPTGPQILNAMDGELATVPSRARAADAPSRFVGRDSTLESLHSAYARCVAGQAVQVYLQGVSGIGKTAIADEFVRQVEELSGSHLVLRCKCHERESVSYKALDGIVDSLSRYLRKLPFEESLQLVPRHARALLRLFPILDTVDALKAAADAERDAPDAQELRARSIDAFDELITRLADRVHLILVIDDLQWGDVESAAILSQLVSDKTDLTVMLLATVRSEGIADNKCIEQLLSAPPLRVDRHQLLLDVVPMPESEAARLAGRLLPDVDPAIVDQVVQDSMGHPYLLSELARYATAKRTSAATFSGLDDMIATRITELADDERRLTEVVSLAGQPLSARDMLHAAQIDTKADEIIARLRDLRLIRTAGPLPDSPLETYHDRIRETVCSRMSLTEREIGHGRLADALLDSQEPNHEAAAYHCEQSRRIAEARSNYIAAGKKAHRNLAFEHAVQLFQSAQSLSSEVEGDEESSVEALLAHSLACAGRGVEAADQFLAAARAASNESARLHRQRAARQLLVSGHVDRALDLYATLLSKNLVKVPRTPVSALIACLLERIALWFEERQFRAHPEIEPSRQVPEHFDVCFSLGTLMTIDPIRAGLFVTRALRLAMRRPVSNRVMRAMAWDSAFLCSGSGGRASRQRLRERIELMESMTQDATPYDRGFWNVCKGGIFFLQGRWREAVGLCDAGEEILRNHCQDVAWEIDTAHSFATWSLYYLGDIQEMATRVNKYESQARTRGNEYAVANQAAFAKYVVRLAADEVDLARSELEQVLSSWSRRGFHVQHQNAWGGLVHVHLYRGDPQAAWDCWKQYERPLKKSLLLNVQIVRVFQLHLMARAAVALAAADELRRRKLLRIARQVVRRIEKEDSALPLAISGFLKAAIADQGEDPQSAAHHLHNAVEKCRQAGLGLFADCGEYRLLQLSYSRGRQQLNDFTERMRERGIARPDLLVNAFVPGFVGP